MQWEASLDMLSTRGIWLVDGSTEMFMNLKLIVEAVK